MGARTVASSLDDLREEIDRIDAALHDLIVQRVEVVRRIGALKGAQGDGRPAMRPAREAQVLRSLIDRAGAAARPGERLPNAVVVRIWRELFAAMTRLQGPLAVAVYAPPESPGYRDLARDHFGAFTPLVPVTRPGQAIHAVGTGAATVAVLPMPGDGAGPSHADGGPWWLALFQNGGEERLRVIAQLPFGAPGFGYGTDVRALAVGRFEHEPSGDDATVLAIEADPGLSRGRLATLLGEADLVPGWSAVWRPSASEGAPVFHLAEVQGFVAEGDGRLGQLVRAGRGEVLRATPAGGYARPLAPEELA